MLKLSKYFALYVFLGALLSSCSEGEPKIESICFSVSLVEDVFIDRPDTFTISHLAIVLLENDRLADNLDAAIVSGFCKKSQVNNNQNWLRPDAIVFLSSTLNYATAADLPVDMCSNPDRTIPDYSKLLSNDEVLNYRQFSAVSALQYWSSGQQFDQGCFDIEQ